MGEPECNDTMSPGEEPQDLSLPIDEEPGVITSNGALAGNGLSPAEALGTDATGVLAVGGFLVDNGGEARLCELFA